MSLRPVATECVPCHCGKGLITLNVTVRTEGLLEYSIEQVAECVVCRSTDLDAARALLPRPQALSVSNQPTNSGT